MDYQQVVDLVMGAVGVAFGWIFKVVWEAIKELQQDMKDTTSSIHQNYVRKDDYRIDLADIKGMFNRIMDKLDDKVDKD